MSDSHPPTGTLLSRARELQEAFDAEEGRRLPTLRALLADVPDDGVVLVMMVNRGYNDLFDNWVRSCDLAGIDPRSRSVVFSVDEEAAANCRRQGFRTFLDIASYGDHTPDAVKVFGDRDFRMLMFQKSAIVHDVLRLGYEVLFQDVDMIWRKDPLPLLLDETARDHDVRFMYDGRNRLHAPLHANTGFFLLRNRPAVRRFWASVMSCYPQIVRCGSQQSVVNKLLPDAGLDVDILPETQFANGHLFSIDKPSRLPPDPYVIHCSWTGNREHKLVKYKRAGLWYL